MLIQITGLDADSPIVKAIASSFLALKNLADFEAASTAEPDNAGEEKNGQEIATLQTQMPPLKPGTGELRMNLAYTINLNLPKSDDVAVFNAIFKALRDNLLK